MRRPLGIFSKSRMPSRSRHVAAAALHLAALSLGASPAFAAWTTVDYGNGGNPTMTLYTPATPDASPGLIVSLHYCTGTAQNAQGWFQQLSEQYGFLIIAPDVGPGECWNADPQRAGEPAAIVKMVDYAIENNNVDPNRVFAAGASSGGCMSEALLAAYPDVFAGGAALAGVPAGFWKGGNSCNGTCGADPPNNTAQQWGDLVRMEAPQGFTGPWPRFQLFHGTTDSTLKASMIPAQVAQWTNVHGVTDADATSENNQPVNGWTRKSYKDDSGTVVFESVTGVANTTNGHDLTGLGLFPDVVRFFGLDMDPPVGSGGAGGAGGSAGAGGTSGGAGGTTGGGATSGGAANGGTSAGTAGAASGAGGTTSTGGTSTSGGTSSSGGAGTGGASGGAPASVGGAATTPSSGETTDNGCGCRVAGAGSGTLGGLATLAAALGMLLRRRQRTVVKRD